MLARSLICRVAVCLALLPAAAAAQASKIPWAKGPAKGLLGSEAAISVPAGCLFTGRDGDRGLGKPRVRQRARRRDVPVGHGVGPVVRAVFLR